MGVREALATHCPQGHPYDEENTRVSRGRRHCRACQRENGLRWRTANPEKHKQSMRASRVRRAERIREYEKSAKERARRAAAKRRLRQDPEWRAREIERRRIYAARPEARLRNQLNLARFRASQVGAAGADYCTIEKLAARIAYYGGLCAYCHGPAREIDHVIPLSRSGSGFPANLVPCCRSCNVSKLNRLLSEWGRRPSLRSAA